MKCSPPGFSVHGILQAKILEWGVECHSLLHRNFPTQGSNPGLLPWRLFTVWATGQVLCQGEFCRWLCAQVVFRQPVCWAVGLRSHHGGGLAWGVPAPEPWFQSGSLQESSHRWIVLTSVCVPTVSHNCPLPPPGDPPRPAGRSGPGSHKWKESEVAQSCPTLCDPMDCNLPGSSVHGILQARILEWVAISFSRGSSWPRDWTQSPEF